MEATKKRYLVIGGTAYDTNIGIDFISQNNKIAFGFPVSTTPEQQTALQKNDIKKLETHIIQGINEFHNEIDEIVVFCNSLSFSLDWYKIQPEISTPIVTLLEVYSTLELKNNSVGLLTANTNTLSSISSFLNDQYQNLSILGLAALPLISKIEQDRIDPATSLSHYFNLCKENNIQDVIIGCTHFETMNTEDIDDSINLIFPGRGLINDLS